MLDAILDLIEILFSAGAPSTDTVEKPRRARLAISIAALAGNLSLYLLLGTSAVGGWPVLVLMGMTLTAGWVLVFSVVDTAKELPSITRLSIAAAVLAAAGIAMAALLVLGMPW